VRIRENGRKVTTVPVSKIRTVYQGDYVRPGAGAGVGALVGLGAGVVGGLMINEGLEGDLGLGPGGSILCTSALTVPVGAVAGGAVGSVIRWSAKKYEIGPTGWTIVQE
jgi:hypothetical protein